MMPGMPPMAQPMPPRQPQPDQLALLSKPSWEDIVGLLHDNVHRSYRIDIETDSTIAGSLESDMSGLAQIMQAVSTFMNETQPMVQSGMLPVDAQKEILMTITRRARMGAAVEDALDKMKGPNGPQPNPDVQIAQMKIQADGQKTQAEQAHDMQKLQIQTQMDQQEQQGKLQFEQQKLAMEAQAEQQRTQNDAALQQHLQQVQAQQVAQQNQLEAQREQMKMQMQREIEQMKAEQEAQFKQQQLEFDRWKVEYDNNTKFAIAELASKTSLKQAAVTSGQDVMPTDGLNSLVDQFNQSMSELLGNHTTAVADAITGLAQSHQQQAANQQQQHESLIHHISRPKTIIRGPDGRMTGVQ